jgi:hypothetical protein
MRTINAPAHVISNAIDPRSTEKAGDGPIGPHRMVASTASPNMQTTSAAVAAHARRRKR